MVVTCKGACVVRARARVCRTVGTRTTRGGLLAILVTIVVGCGTGTSPGTASSAPSPVPTTQQPAPPPVLDDPRALAAAGVTVLRPQVVATAPHDTGAFTEGLELSDGVLLEGTGLRGRSQLREVDPATGAVRRAVDLPASQFGEGVTVIGSSIWQLTWTDGVAYERDRATLAVRRTVPLPREGWGLCADGSRLVSGDGSDELVVRDPATFAPVGSVHVRVAGQPLTQINELECTPSGIWANIWQTDHLVRIDPTIGRVTAVVDAAGLLPDDQRANSDAVLNGITAIPGTDQFWLTGKLWPTSFRVRFVPR